MIHQLNRCRTRARRKRRRRLRLPPPTSPSRSIGSQSISSSSASLRFHLEPARLAASWPDSRSFQTFSFHPFCPFDWTRTSCCRSSTDWWTSMLTAAALGTLPAAPRQSTAVPSSDSAPGSPSVPAFHR